MRKIRLLGFALLLCLGACIRSPENNTHFAGGQAPIIAKQSLQVKTTLLDFEAFTVLHSGVSRTPLWSAEHLTAANVASARQLKRRNRFHAEPNLPIEDRAELLDYARSGLDRGHMSPSGDMPTDTAQHESFSLANMIPQNSNNNQHLWEGIEEATRSLAEQDGDLFIITGPLFEGSDLQRLNGRVLVPSAVYKAIFDPKRNEAAAYVTPNQPGMRYDTLSIAAIEARSGINLFPALSPQIKAATMNLPAPTPHSARHRAETPGLRY